jgi:glycosyltransferase involved in cell wall biosynthesis
MRWLFVSNFFPPEARGGYEQWCEEVAIGLQQRGHTLCVLTTRSSCSRLFTEECLEVRRLLQREVEGGLLQTARRLLFEWRRVEAENVRQVQMTVDKFRPDAALIWGMWNIPRSVPAQIERLLPGRTLYYFCDYWPTLPNAYMQRWQEPARRASTRLLKWGLGRYFLWRLQRQPTTALRLERPICVSKAVQRELIALGAPVQHATVIYGGTQPEKFAAAARCRKAQPEAATLQLVYIGRLDREKGVATAILAVARLAAQFADRLTLDIYGQGDADYRTELAALVDKLNLHTLVKLHGSVPRTEIPTLLAGYDVLVFPSHWQEPFARTVLEGLASGLAVVGSTTGGTVEILVEGETGLTFPAGDDAVLARQLQRLLEEPHLRQQLGRQGQQRVAQHFTLHGMVERLEAELLAANSLATGNRQ